MNRFNSSITAPRNHNQVKSTARSQSYQIKIKIKKTNPENPRFPKVLVTLGGALRTIKLSVLEALK